MNKQLEEAIKLITIIIKESEFHPLQYIYSEEKKALQTLLSLAQLFLSVKGVPKKKRIDVGDFGADSISLVKNKKPEIWTQEKREGYNLCHDEFTAWLAGRMEKIEEIIKLSWLNTNARADLLKLGKPTERLEEINKEQCEQLATAIKTMIMGREK